MFLAVHRIMEVNPSTIGLARVKKSKAKDEAFDKNVKRCPIR